VIEPQDRESRERRDQVRRVKGHEGDEQRLPGDCRVDTAARESAYEDDGSAESAARQQLIDAGVEASDVDAQPWGNFVYFRDPDGNRWAVQALESRPNG